MFSKLFLLLLACSCGITDILASHNVTHLHLTKSCGCGIDQGGPIVQQLTKASMCVNGANWDYHTHQVYFVDKHLSSTFKYDLKTGATTIIYIKELHDQEVTSIHPIHKRAHQHIIAANHTLYLLKVEHKEKDITYTIKEVMKVMDESQIFSKSIISKRGNLIIGTNPANYKSNDTKKGEAQLLCVNMTSQKVEVIDTGFDSVSGVCFDFYSRHLFVSDGKMGKIWLYNYNMTTGKTSDKKIIFDIKDHNHTVHGTISSITMDREHQLWIGMKKSYQVLVYDVHLRTIVHKIPIPASGTSTLVWGGKHYDTLFVGASMLTHTDHKREPAAGRLMAISGTGSKGFHIPRIHVPENIE